MYINNPNASTQSSNISQFGGVAVSTGTGVGGAGMPRVTVSSDSFKLGTIVTGNNITVPAGSGTSYVPDPATVETLFSNQDGSLEVFIRDTASMGLSVGTLLGPKATASINCNGKVHLTNAGGTNVTVSVNELRTP